MRVVDIPPGDGTKAGFLRSFADAVGLPGLHAYNWDAFADALSAYVADVDRPLELNHREMPRLHSEGDLGVYVDVLTDLANQFPGHLASRFPEKATPPPADRCPPAAAIAHYHLNRGGVTRVVANHLLALRANQINPPWAVLLTGGRAEAWSEFEHTLEHEGVRAARPTVAGFDYDSLYPGDAAPNPAGLADRFEKALTDHRATREETVLHVHNHSLGKNVSLPGAIVRLAERGWKILLQIHDFAEEFRPANYLHLVGALGEGANLYPQAPQIHYAVLNGRDRGVLQALGVPAERLHFLPNPVGAFPPLPDKLLSKAALGAACDVPAEHRYLCYPVRGIRRKNLGEAALTGLLEPDSTVGVTLAPRNPVELAFHDRWRSFAEALQLPIRFATGEEDGVSFHQNLAAADAVLTTSVAEGFGMAFLECWLADRPLLGRDLPHVTADFRAEGIELPGLYSSLTIPLAWAEGFADRFRAGCEKLLTDYRRPWDEAAFAEALAAKTAGDRVDFGDLDEDLQMAVIRRIADDPAARGEVFSVEPKSGLPRDGVVEHNAATVRERYSLAGSGARLAAAYGAVLASPVGPVTPPPHPGAVLDSFLDLKTFRLIRG
ncbi:barstar family protein [Alienimonas californiensis]|uniref:barstar family protein n=1 Tax=Alienimonas californiensis TaxID=2527989 RepID=UPI0013FCFBE1|nr:barstar family protein [Alienimonas californiensis]